MSAAKKTRKKEKKKASRAVLIAVLAVVAAVLIALLVVAGPLFNITEIDVTIENSNFESAAHYSEEDFKEYFSGLVGQNGFRALIDNSSVHQTKGIFSREFAELEDKAEVDFPYLENIVIKYNPRNTLEVRAVERKASFLTECYGIYLLCDRHGIVLQSFPENEMPEGFPLVKGISVHEYKLWRSISGGQDDNADCAIRVCGLLTQLGMEDYIDIVDVSDYNDIYLFCAPSLTVQLGSTENIGPKLQLLKGIMDDEQGLDGYSDGVLRILDGKQSTFRKNTEQEE